MGWRGALLVNVDGYQTVIQSVHAVMHSNPNIRRFLFFLLATRSPYFAASHFPPFLIEDGVWEEDTII